MLQALLDRDIVPDVVVGCSAGALNGAVIATDPTPATVEHLADVWLSIRSGDVFPGSKLVRAWNILRRDDHLFPDDGLRAIVERARAAPTFEELEVPLRVVATDLDGGEEVVFASGPIEPALLASAAIPGLFPPVEHDGRLLVDGAVTNSVPLGHALAGPVDRVYVCNVTGSLAERRLRSPLDVAVRAFAISRNQRFDLELRHAPPDVDVVLLPTPVDQRDLFDFSDSMMLIEEAHHLVGRALDEHEAQQARAPERARRRWFRRRHDVA
jgi:NTE family protein